MRRTIFVLFIMAGIASAHGATPGDSAAGKRLHDANCLQCHQPDVYTKKDRSVKSLDELKQQLIGCSHQLQKPFSATDMQNLLKYVNEEFYKFP